MITTEYINPRQHRVYDAGRLIGYITYHNDRRDVGWMFSAATKALAKRWLDTTMLVTDWQNALPIPSREG